jgi:RNA polymerase sigma factor (sigma-70 family)
MRRLPFTRSNKYESNLHKYRVEKGYTVKELAELVDTNTNMIVGLANGTIPPVHRGEAKLVVLKLSEMLDVALEDLFPEYAFQFNTVAVGVTNEQIEEALYQDVLPDEEYDCIEFNEAVAGVLLPKELDVIHARYYEGKTLDEVGRILRRTIESVRQIEAKALRKLRHPSAHMDDFRCILQN